MTAGPATPDPKKLNQKVALLAGMMTGAHVAAMIVLGLRLGLYRSLAGAGMITSEGLAMRTGLNERWLREWMRGQAAAGVLDYADGQFALSPEVSLLLADEDQMSYLGGNFLPLPARMASLDRLTNSFRTGLGLTFDDRGPEGAAAVEQLFRNWYRVALVPQALPALEGAVEKLQAGARVADVGCGAGLAIIEMARSFPDSQFDGYDTSTHALARAEEHRAGERVSNVRFHNPTGDPLPPEPTFDLITTFDCLHDMTHPEPVAAAIRRAIKPDGVWFIADINGAPTFEEQLRNATTPMLYAMSVLACMSSALSEPGGAGLGTLGLPEPAMRDLVTDAGFTRFRRVELPHPINAFYEARP